MSLGVRGAGGPNTAQSSEAVRSHMRAAQPATTGGSQSGAAAARRHAGQCSSHATSEQPEEYNGHFDARSGRYCEALDERRDLPLKGRVRHGVRGSGLRGGGLRICP